ncbi:MAG: hypothetical protein IJO57_04405 [Bacilli bacterium]|nr:hypothetical protein [Bacilli bacterium]
MKNIKTYNLYLVISTFTRNIIDLYSVVYLYKLGFNVNNIILVYTIIFLLGILISYLSLKIGNALGYKYILIFSSIITSISFYILKNSTNLFLIAIFLSLSIHTYHPVKHYYGMNLLKEKNIISKSILLVFISSFIASYFVIKEINNLYLIIISIIGIIPTLYIKKEPKKEIIYKKIDRSKIKYFILDQTRVLFLLFEPLYLFIVANKISFVGTFNIVITISSILYLYFISNKLNLEKNYKYINIFFVIILILKLNIKNKIFLLIIAFFEGIGLKTNEVVSTHMLYKDKTSLGYLIKSETIFLLTKSIILLIIYIFKIKLVIFMYLLLIGVFLLSFKYKKR